MHLGNVLTAARIERTGASNSTSFQKKKKKKSPVGLRKVLSESYSSGRGVLQQLFFDLSLYWRHCSFEAGEKTGTCRPAWRICTWLLAPMWSRLFFIFTLYEANGICSWLTSNLEKWSSLGLQLAGLRLLVVFKQVRQQQVFFHKSRGKRNGYEKESPSGPGTASRHRGRLHLVSELPK